MIKQTDSNLKEKKNNQSWLARVVKHLVEDVGSNSANVNTTGYVLDFYISVIVTDKKNLKENN